jgi:hypothetical protein
LFENILAPARDPLGSVDGSGKDAERGDDDGDERVRRA